MLSAFYRNYRARPEPVQRKGVVEVAYNSVVQGKDLNHGWCVILLEFVKKDPEAGFGVHENVVRAIEDTHKCECLVWPKHIEE